MWIRIVRRMRASCAKVQRATGGSTAFKAGRPNAQTSIAHDATLSRKLALYDTVRRVRVVKQARLNLRNGADFAMGVSAYRSRTSRNSGGLNSVGGCSTQELSCICDACRCGCWADLQAGCKRLKREADSYGAKMMVARAGSR